MFYKPCNISLLRRCRMSSGSPTPTGYATGYSSSRDSRVTDHTQTDNYLGDTFHFVVGGVELGLGVQAIICNLLVLAHYHKMYKRTIPLMYVMISGCDMVTGLAAFLTGILILSVKSYPALATDMSYVVYPVYSLTFAVSIFLNLTLAVIRTINIFRPFYRIRLVAVCAAVCFYTLGWAVFTGWHMRRWTRHVSLLRSYIFAPGQYQAAYNSATSIKEECRNIALFVGFPYILPSLIVLVCMVVQVVSIRRQERDDRKKRQRHVTMTILLLTSLFFTCNTVYLYWPLTHCSHLQVVLGELSARRVRSILRHITGVLFPFINAAFNPVILVVRGGLVRGLSGRREEEEEGTVLTNGITSTQL